jgi:hypothetical protein
MWINIYHMQSFHQRAYINYFHLKRPVYISKNYCILRFHQGWFFWGVNKYLSIACCSFIKAHILIIQRTKIQAHKLSQSMTPKISVKKIILIGQKKFHEIFLMFAKSFNNEQYRHTYFIGDFWPYSNHFIKNIFIIGYIFDNVLWWNNSIHQIFIHILAISNDNNITISFDEITAFFKNLFTYRLFIKHTNRN